MSRAEKQKRSNQGLGRARLLYQRDLAWTSGFPLSMLGYSSDDQNKEEKNDADKEQLCWIRLDSLSVNAKPFIVDRDVLRRSTMAASKLRHQFPRAVKKVFSDPEQWFARLDRILEAVKAFLHDGDVTCLESDHLLSTVAQLKPQNEDVLPFQPALPPVVDALRLGESMIRKPRELSIDSWLNVAAPHLKKLSTCQPRESKSENNRLSQSDYEFCLLMLLRHELSDADRLKRIINLLTSEAVRKIHHPDPTKHIMFWSAQARTFLLKEQSAKEKVIQGLVELPERITTRPKLVRLLAQALHQKPQQRQAYVDGISILGHDHVLRPMDKVYREINQEEQRLQSIAGKLQNAYKYRLYRSSNFASPSSEEVEDRPVGERGLEYLGSWHSAFAFFSSGIFSPAIVREINLFVESVGQEVGVVLEMIARWQRSLEEIYSRSSVLNKDWGRLFAALNQVARQTSGEQVAKLVRVPQRGPVFCRVSLIDCICGVADRFGQRFTKLPTKEIRIKRFASILGQLLATKVEVLSPSMFESLPTLIVSPLPIDKAMDLLLKLHQDKDLQAIEIDDIDLVYPFTYRPNEVFELRGLLEDADIDFDLLRSLKKLENHKLGKTMVNRWIRNRCGKTIQFFSGLLSLAPPEIDFALPEDAKTKSTTWMQRYPLAIQESLQLLHSVCENAEKVADKILAKDFGNENKRQSEIQFLKYQLELASVGDSLRAKFQNRLRHLEQLDYSQWVVSDRRIKNLREKLLDRAIYEFQSRLRDTLLDRLCAELPAELRKLLEKRLTQREFSIVAVGIFKLDWKLKQFGTQLLYLGLSDQRFPELDYEENKQFLEELSKSGINIRPWMDLSRTSKMPWKDDHEIMLSFASMPMDYLLMGHHFQTCLSPSSFNFYSTIANAVDVNKRVIYGRDASGNVIGRCLIALTSSGQLVRFHAYSHDDGERFNQLIQSFIDELLTEMGAVRAASPTSVPRLVADRWYDDGAVPREGNTSPRDDALRWLRKSSQYQQEHLEVANEIKSALAATIREQDLGDLIYYLECDFAPWAMELILKELLMSNQAPVFIVSFAEKMFMQHRSELVNRALSSLSMKTLLRVFRRSSCVHAGCFGFHNIGEQEFVQVILDLVGPTNGLKLLRASRKREIKRDIDEVCTRRRKLLANCHDQLGRNQLANKLRSRF